MADNETTLRQLIDCVAEFERRRDWAQFHSPKNLAMGLAVEAGELMERFLWQTTGESREVVRDEDELNAVRDEMADVLNYLLMLAHTLNVDLSEAFYQKMRRNEQKYPADLYRGKYKL